MPALHEPFEYPSSTNNWKSPSRLPPLLRPAQCTARPGERSEPDSSSRLAEDVKWLIREWKANGPFPCQPSQHFSGPEDVLRWTWSADKPLKNFLSPGCNEAYQRTIRATQVTPSEYSSPHQDSQGIIKWLPLPPVSGAKVVWQQGAARSQFLPCRHMRKKISNICPTHVPLCLDPPPLTGSQHGYLITPISTM